MPHEECPCLAGGAPSAGFEERYVGMDSQEGRWGDVFICTCRTCGQHWLLYDYEHEAFTGSGRWWRGPISPEEAATVTAESAFDLLGTLPFYYTGGSYRGGRIFKKQGPIGPIYP